MCINHGKRTACPQGAEPQGNRSKAFGSVPAASLGPCEKGFNTKAAKIAKITKQVIECASREAPYSPAL
jgi:hypothetical protein